MSEKQPFHGAAGQHHLYGDVYPSNASYSDPIWGTHLLKMYYRNEFIQFMIDWMPAEAFRNWVIFIEEETTYEGVKYGKPYTFKGYEHEDPETQKITRLSPFNEYLQWNDVPVNWIQGVGWSRLYNEGSLLVFLDDDEDLLKQSEREESEIIWAANSDPQGYTRFIVYQPVANDKGTGFQVYDGPDGVNADGSVNKWKITMHSQHMKAAKTFIIDAERCIHLLWKKKENGWKACSRVIGMVPTCKMEEQTFQKLTKRAHDVAGGILTITGVASEAESDAISAALGDDLTSVDRLMLKEGREAAYITPDLKASGEFASIFEMYTKKLVRHMQINQQILDGEKSGAGLGGNTDNDVELGYTEMNDIQEHYRNYLEKVFYKLGKANTSFVYRVPMPDDQRVEQNMQREMMDHEDYRLEQTGGSPNKNDNRDGGSRGDDSQNKNREQTRQS